MRQIRELRAKRAKAVADARAVITTAEAAKRELTAEESAQYDTLFAEQERIGREIAREERQLEVERELAAAKSGDADSRDADGDDEGEDNVIEMADLQARVNEVRVHGQSLAAPAAATRAERRRWGKAIEKRFGRPASPTYRAAFRSYLRNGRNGVTADESRALQSDIDTAGGFLVTPMQMVAGLIKAIDDQTFIRGLATVYQVPTAASLGSVSLEADPADADWTVELAIGGEDSTMSFGRRELHPHPLAKLIKIAEKLLRMNADTEGLVNRRLGYKFGIAEEKAFLTGTGAEQPLGIFTPSPSGIPTTRDVVTGSTTALTFDGLHDAKYALKVGYWANARWLFHRDAVKQIAKFKDTTNQYIWQPSKKLGEPDMLLGLPVLTSEYVPATFTTGKYVGMVGDFSYFWIADALDVRMQRLIELFAATNQIGIIGRKETDGMPVLGEAFSRIITS